MPIFKSKTLTEAQDRLDTIAELFTEANLDLEAITGTGDKHALRDAINQRLTNAGTALKAEHSTEMETAMGVAKEADKKRTAAEERVAMFGRALVSAGVFRKGAEVEAIQDKEGSTASEQIAAAIADRASTLAAEQVAESGLTSAEQVEQDVAPDATSPSANSDEQWAAKIKAATGANKIRMIREYKRSQRSK